MMRSLLLAVVLAVLPLAAAEEAPRYPCHRLPSAPVLDGRLDDAAWAAAPEAVGFHVLGRDGYAVRKPTTFRAGWTADAFYLAVRCAEPFTSRLKALTGDGEALWDDDSVELFLAPAPPDYLQLIANSAGARWNGTRAGAVDQPLPWEAKAAVAGGAWTLELRVPFAVIGRTPGVGQAWKFNLGRNVLTGPASERFSAWAPVKGGFSDLAHFAELAFLDAPAAGAVAAAEQDLGAAYTAFLKQRAAANAVVNGSFEDGLKGWGLREGARISIDETTATDGRRAIKLDGSGAPDLFVNAMQGLKLKPGTKYVLRCDLQRSRFSSGVISADVIERDAKDVEWTYHRCGDRPDKADTPGAWAHYELRFRTSDKLLDAMLMLYNIKSGAVAWYDNLEVVEDDGTETVGAPPATRTLRLEVTARDAAAKLTVGGQAVELKPGQPVNAPIREGLTVLGVEATAQGANPGVKVRLVGQPETDGRWRAGAAEATGWLAPEFDDQAWPQASADGDGYLWAAKGTRTALLRQVILWNLGHDGPDRCLNPLAKEWGISEGSAESLHLALYSPFPFRLSDYEFQLDLPAGFRLLNVQHPDGRNLLNRLPAKVTAEPVTHDGQPYTRYRLAHPPDQVRPDQIDGLILPVYLDRWAGAAKTTAWYYRRLAKGNFTELEQRIPVRVLPPINGRMCKRIQLSQYCALPWGYTHLSPEHLDQHLKQSFAAGFNTWILSQSNVDKDAYLKTVHDRVLAAGGKLILWTNYPYFGAKQGEAGWRWVQATPAAQARYFDGTDTWQTRGQYCPAYATAEGRAGFLAAVKADYATKLAGLPGASVVWSDWEEAVWVSGGAPYQAPRDGKGSWCFCDRCKAEFRRWAKLPADADHSDTAIFGRYKQLWESFRVELDGRVAEVAKQAANELGKPYMIYSWTAHPKFWKACKGRIDLAFPGCPGNGAADGSQQMHLDDTAAMFRDQVGLDRSKVMGQRFSYFFYYTLKEPAEFWKKWAVMSPSGYIEPKTWKSQILRVVAALGMGIDLQSSVECSAGMLYWIGEATRILAAYEDVFATGERADPLATSDQLQYPQLLVLKKGTERVVLLFNETDQPLTVTLQNKDLAPGQTAEVFETGQRTDQPATMRVTVPEGDVAVVHVK